MPRLIVLLMFGTLINAQSAQAQDTFEARQGRAFAERVCSGCHGVVLGATSLAAGAPNFYTVARTPGMSPLARGSRDTSPFNAEFDADGR